VAPARCLDALPVPLQTPTLTFSAVQGLSRRAWLKTRTDRTGPPPWHHCCACVLWRVNGAQNLGLHYLLKSLQRDVLAMRASPAGLATVQEALSGFPEWCAPREKRDRRPRDP
jgi:hypothetical protein